MSGPRGKEWPDIYEQIQRNRRRSLLLLALFVGLVLAVGWIFDVLLGLGAAALAAAAVVAVLAASGSYLASDRVALAMSRARPVGREEQPRYHNLVEGLCIAAGLPKPDLYLIDDPAPNAFATGRNPTHAAVAITTGLLDKMDRIELEGVLAHELSHIRNYDVLVGTIAVTLVGLVAPPLVPLAVNRRQESLADVTGVGLTRYPPGLISALEKMREEGSTVHSSRATAHLWIDSPLDPPLATRIKALREL
jgi:heat shock protein HtpX